MDGIINHKGASVFPQMTQQTPTHNNVHTPAMGKAGINAKTFIMPMASKSSFFFISPTPFKCIITYIPLKKQGSAPDKEKSLRSKRNEEIFWQVAPKKISVNRSSLVCMLLIVYSFLFRQMQKQCFLS